MTHVMTTSANESMSGLLCQNLSRQGKEQGITATRQHSAAFTKRSALAYTRVTEPRASNRVAESARFLQRNARKTRKTVS
ncbi:hypothetical protein BT69DRAFT_10440 [Atractiella rhizophila]|nr:hypothetical protein BT69DRAFT_10440 [Atractiella rhizophila]